MNLVSIIIPCYNEQGRISRLLEAIHAQSYPRKQMEVIIADGMSQDATRADISAFAASHPDLKIIVVDNPLRIIPAALNCALRTAQGSIIIRLDGHSFPYPDYVERCVAALETGLGANVGGIWEIQPGAPTWAAAAIAVAAAHPLGAGDASYRLSATPGSVDTVPFGAFKRELLATVGFFNESLLTNEDYEFNARIRARGGVIWLDPTIRSVYYARSSFKALAQQYWRYGYWKWQMLRRFPGTLRWRQALPPLFTAGLLGSIPLIALVPFLRLPLGILLGLYALVLATAGILEALRRSKATHLLGLPVAVFIMHFFWGGGFLWSMIGGNTRKKDPAIEK